MRFSKASMPALTDLLRELDIGDEELVPFHMQNTEEPGSNNMYIR